MTGLTNAEIKLIRSLREKKFRDETGLFVVEGEKMVREALQSGYQIERTFLKEEIGEEAMKKISSLVSPPPAIALVHRKEFSVSISETGLYLALDSVRDPGNMGTIIRIADWFGVDAVFASEDSVEIYNPKVIQSSMGSIFRTSFVYTDIPRLCEKFQSQNLPVYGTFLDGTDIYRQELSRNGLIVMGNESNGISGMTAAVIDRRLFIPSYGKSGAESLNVAVATAVTLAEFRRR